MAFSNLPSWHNFCTLTGSIVLHILHTLDTRDPLDTRWMWARVNNANIQTAAIIKPHRDLAQQLSVPRMGLVPHLSTIYIQTYIISTDTMLYYVSIICGEWHNNKSHHVTMLEIVYVWLFIWIMGCQIFWDETSSSHLQSPVSQDARQGRNYWPVATVHMLTCCVWWGRWLNNRERWVFAVAKITNTRPRPAVTRARPAAGAGPGVAQHSLALIAATGALDTPYNE